MRKEQTELAVRWSGWRWSEDGEFSRRDELGGGKAEGGKENSSGHLCVKMGVGEAFGCPTPA